MSNRESVITEAQSREDWLIGRLKNMHEGLQRLRMDMERNAVMRMAENYLGYTGESAIGYTIEDTIAYLSEQRDAKKRGIEEIHAGGGQDPEDEEDPEAEQDDENG